MNVKRIEGALLNLWVARSAGLKILPAPPPPGVRHDPENGNWHPLNFHPASDWSHAGIIVSSDWYDIENILIEWFGPDWPCIPSIVDSPLKWFMRAYVASQFGDEVEDFVNTGSHQTTSV